MKLKLQIESEAGVKSTSSEQIANTCVRACNGQHDADDMRRVQEESLLDDVIASFQHLEQGHFPYRGGRHSFRV
jgi:hypothetical protein